MHSPEISVIVPVYNVQPYLKDCIESILAQEFENLEIILVDDGSTDDSGAICDKYTAHERRVRTIHQNNLGLSSARNAGIKVSRGRYLSFIDADDMVGPNFLGSLYSADADVAQCAYTRRLSDLSDVAVAQFAACNGRAMVEKLLLDSTGNYTVVWNKLWRREAIIKFPFPSGKYHEDEFWTWRMMWNSVSCAYTDRALYFYRSREGSITGTALSKRSFDAVEALRERFLFFDAAQEERFSILTRATYCSRLSALLAAAIPLTPEERTAWNNSLKKEYATVIASRQIDWRKKARLQISMRFPKQYLAAKEFFRAYNT